MAAINNIVYSSLKHKLIELIRLRGPLSVADYMKIVLTNPESGFYTNKEVFGVKGHFTTNPEISQLFGEVLGVWILNEWRRFGSPKPLNLIEFGPGRGTLMLDLMRTFKNFGETPSIKLIEVSPKLKEIQNQVIARENYAKPRWFTTIDELDKEGDGFNAFIAHEFLDVLPIHKFVRDPKTKAMRELLIDYDQKQELRFCIARQPSLSVRLLVPEDFKGDHLEVCAEAALQMEKVSKRLNKTGKGCMIVCDYGFEDGKQTVESDTSSQEKVDSGQLLISDRDTFRAFKSHDSWPPLRDPGEADLTADVDFGYLKNHLNDKALLFGSVNQRCFLKKCGLEARMDRLLVQTSDYSERQELITGFNMMTNDMGDRYRFLAIFPKGSEHLFKNDPPAGFD